MPSRWADRSWVARDHACAVRWYRGPVPTTVADGTHWISSNLSRTIGLVMLTSAFLASRTGRFAFALRSATWLTLSLSAGSAAGDSTPSETCPLRVSLVPDVPDQKLIENVVSRRWSDRHPPYTTSGYTSRAVAEVGDRPGWDHCPSGRVRVVPRLQGGIDGEGPVEGKGMHR